MDHEKYDHLLQETVNDIKHDFKSGAREMADSSLRSLSALIEAASISAGSDDDLWNMTLGATKALCKVRPSMNAAISSCLLRAVNEMKITWDMFHEEKKLSRDTVVAAWMKQIQDFLDTRAKTGKDLSEHFTSYVGQHASRASESSKPLVILTLSNSSTIRACISTFVSSRLPSTYLVLHILESRPHFEGAAMASQILASVSPDHMSRLRLRIFPDCAVAAAVRNVDLVVLGADRISATGDVSNKIGSLAAAILARQMDAKTKVVVVSDVDKIAPPDLEEVEEEVHHANEMMGAWGDAVREEIGQGIEAGNVEVFGEWFEWVGADLVDAYVTEQGVLDHRRVREFADEGGRLRSKFWDGRRSDFE